MESGGTAQLPRPNADSQQPQPTNDERPANSPQGNDDDEAQVSQKFLNELMYSFASYHAIVAPVSITMILAALLVVYINTDETRAAGEASFANTYEAFDLEEDNAGQNLAVSLVNTLIIVSVICIMTFVVVLLYKYRCMKILFGYMIVATTTLLGYFSSQMWRIAIDIYNLRIDKISFYFILYNFAAVGTVAIFYGKGFPRFISQGYLIASSVILAWQLSYFNEWTAWTLLVMLALYDLFAVLSPCGPLKALVHQMQRPDAPEMPGLLYEANLPIDVRRPNRPQQQRPQANTEASPASRPQEATATTERMSNDENIGSSLAPLPNVSIQSESSQPSDDPLTVAPPISMTRSTITGEIEMLSFPRRSNERPASRESVELTLPPPESAESTTSPAETPQSDVESLPTGKVALAVAKVYKLKVIDDEGVLRQRGQRREEAQRVYTPEDVRARQWTPKQLKADVTVVFPRRGGRIERADPRKRGEGPQYIVYNRDRQILRTFVVNDRGELFQVVERSGEDDPKDNTIKLGLVSSARMYTVRSSLFPESHMIFSLRVY
jgi:hypothetical protein